MLASGVPLGATGEVPTRVGELLLARSLKVAAVLLVAFVVDRVARWTVRRIVRGLQQQGVQQRLRSIRAKTPRALLASTDPLPSLRRSHRADAIGAVLRNLALVVIWLLGVVSILRVLGVRLGPLLPVPASSVWRSGWARSSWSATSSRASRCCSRTSTAWAM
jgi:hypothetical protein